NKTAGERQFCSGSTCRMNGRDARDPIAWQSPLMSTSHSEALRRALDLARLAPSAHNTQPWQVERDGELVNVLRDESRHLAHGDPLRRDQTLGLGAFCEA